MIATSQKHEPPSSRLGTWITAVSNFSVQYNFQAISIALLVMSDSQCTSSEENCRNGVQAAWVGPTVAGTVFAGAVVGQLAMGWLGDRIGRDPAMLLTLSVSACAAACSALLPSGSAASVYTTIIASRFILGNGLGGVYPLSAAKATESASANDGPKKAARAFFWQTPGALSPWVAAYILSYWPSLSAEAFWRLLLGMGAVPAAAVAVLSLLEMKEVSKLHNAREQSGGAYRPLTPPDRKSVV